jgi:hypothetical protein
MGRNDYLGVNEASTRPGEKPSKFASQWAISRVETQAKPESTKKRRQIKNLALLFIIYAFRETKKILVQKRPKGNY